MTNVAMPVFISSQPADARWGEKALITSNNDGVTLHLTQSNPLDAVQKAGRKLDGMGIKNVRLLGSDWNLEYCWHFWQGFRNPKSSNLVEWPEMDAEQRDELDRRLKIIDWVRETINLPADELSPLQLVNRAVDLLTEVGKQAVSYRLIKGDELRDKRYMGLHTVGRGSVREPVLLSLDFNPEGNLSTPVVACLVGKGITFDSGGYSLKPSGFMDSMKSDMGGAATVVGALALAISRGLQKRVKLILCCADNLVSGNAFKLGDIIHYRNGKTVEIMNTDAEGRLVLADGLIDASEENAPLIIDCATLTGAAKTAVGNDYHSLLSFDDELANEMLSCAAKENERFWRLPLAEFHRSQLPSNFADLNNIASPSHLAGASTAAAFLSHFVKDYQRGWLHIDCSATYRKSAVEQWSAGATGLGVRAIANLLLKKAD